MQYHSLNDAAAYDPAFNRGARFAIWYMNANTMSQLMMAVTLYGVAGISEKMPSLALPRNLDTLQQSHRLLGCIAGRGHTLSTLFGLMQGEHWSPQGEANGLLTSKGVAHTSMSCGDVIVDNGEIWMVDRDGFESLGRY